MKPSDRLKLRKIGTKYILVDTCTDDGIAQVYSMNETAAMLWQKMCEGDFSTRDLAVWICEHYDIEQEVVYADIIRQIEEWKNYGLLK